MGPSEDKFIDCEECEGDGVVECDDCLGDGIDGHTGETCEECNGDGTVECYACDGSGIVENPEYVETQTSEDIFDQVAEAYANNTQDVDDIEDPAWLRSESDLSEGETEDMTDE